MPDSSRHSLPRKAPSEWETDEELASLLHAKFQPVDLDGTGGEGMKKKKSSGEGGESDASEDAYGDFEDLELGKVFKGAYNVSFCYTDGSAAAGLPGIADAEVDKEAMKKKALILKKEMLKEQFNAEYDEKGAGKDFFTLQKEHLASQAATNRAAFANEDPEERVKLEGFRPGAVPNLEFS